MSTNYTIKGHDNTLLAVSRAGAKMRIHLNREAAAILDFPYQEELGYAEVTKADGTLYKNIADFTEETKIELALYGEAGPVTQAEPAKLPEPTSTTEDDGLKDDESEEESTEDTSEIIALGQWRSFVSMGEMKAALRAAIRQNEGERTLLISGTITNGKERIGKGKQPLNAPRTVENALVTKAANKWTFMKVAGTEVFAKAWKDAKYLVK